MQTLHLVERAALGGAKVGEGIVEGVKILSPVSTNGRVYGLDAIRKAVPLYEGARVNVDHGPAGTHQRSYGDRFGSLRNVRIDADGGLRGDLKFNPRHRLAEQFAWDAVHDPAACGLSHNVEGKTVRTADGTLLVEEIVRVRSVDLVADPATVLSLYEATMADEPAQEAPKKDEPASGIDYTKVTIADLMAARPDLVDELMKESKARITALEAELAAAKGEKETVAKESRVERLLRESGLHAGAITPVFLETLKEAKDEAAVKRLIEDRRVLALSGGKPGYTPPAAPAAMTYDQFITGLKD